MKVTFHMKPMWHGRMKLCSNGPDHMTEMAAIPIYGKNKKKKFFSRTTGWIALKLDM